MSDGSGREAEEEGIDYFEHGADIGVIGRGATVEEAFERAAAATFGVMVDRHTLARATSIEVAFEEDDIELALTRWLNELLAAARVEHLALGAFDLKRDGNYWHGTARGERWRPTIERGVEVKGATLTMLSVRQDERGWEARCVVDV